MKAIRFTPQQLEAYNAKRGGYAPATTESRLADETRARLAAVQAPKKYRNRPTGGYASSKEARRAEQLKLRQAAGEITGLLEQVPFVLLPAQKDELGKLIERPCMYIADFRYYEPDAKTKDGWRMVVEDCKGIRTPEYILKRKLMLFRHGIRIRET